MPDMQSTPDSYEAACRVAEQHMPGWTAQREQPKPRPVVSDALPAPSLAYMKAKIAAQEQAERSAQAQTHMVPLSPKSGGGGIAGAPKKGPGARVVLVQGSKVVGYSG